MLSYLAPHLYLSSVLELDADRLSRLGLRGLLLDVDCTLKDHGATEFPAAVHAWVKMLRAAGLRLCLLSNGKPRRIGELARQLELPFVAQAFKPLPRGCVRAMKMLELAPQQTAMVGDQLFADVLAGRLAGLYTILVHPTSPHEPWFTRIKRPIERLLIR
ncbi:MAG TPA: YqeG family HAD IIIA-type phosphatase [Gemmataceae bacterium]|nr:YqeG family HAD IIIA-type phosphatase [Gemmataceae bacterium]